MARREPVPVFVYEVKQKTTVKKEARKLAPIPEPKRVKMPEVVVPPPAAPRGVDIGTTMSSRGFNNIEV